MRVLEDSWDGKAKDYMIILTPKEAKALMDLATKAVTPLKKGETFKPPMKRSNMYKMYQELYDRILF